MASKPDTPEGILGYYWGFDSFRPLQREIIDSFLAGHDTIGLLPTGGGKSVTFQVPALLLPGITLVVTPLVSLMKDQVDNLLQRGIRAVYFHAGLTNRENKLAVDRCRLGKVKLAYVSPEKLQRKSFLEELERWTLSAIVVDEAHCISQWGYDFRPSYLSVGKVRAKFPDLPVLALTASATGEVVKDIADKLSLKDYNLFSKSFTRPNISYLVRYTEHKEDKLVTIMTHVSGSAIVYVRSRKKTREVASVLQAAGISADFYHAGLSPEDKADKQDKWRLGQIKVIVATNAFGMGIDKADVRLVAHLQLPPSVEEYYQESGRAGRDGLPAYSIVLVSKKDASLLRRRVSVTYPDKNFIFRIYELMCVFLNVSVGEGDNTLHEFMLEKFCHTYRLPETQVLSALTILSRAGWIEYIEEPVTRSRVMIIAKKSDFYNVKLNKDTEEVLQKLMRLYTGLFSDFTAIDENRILLSLGAGHSHDSVYKALLDLASHHLIHYIPRRATPSVYFPCDRVDTARLYLTQEVYDRQKESMSKRAETMIDFAYNQNKCRSRIILEYFGENPPEDCGSCDYCRGKRVHAPSKDTVENMRKWLVNLLTHGPATIQQIKALAPGWQALVESEVRNLCDSGVLKLDMTTVSLLDPSAVAK